MEFVTPRSSDSNLDIDTDEGEALRYRLIDDLMQNTQRVEACEVEHAEVHVTSADEPSTFAEAVSNPCWMKAMQEEMSSITDNKTWSLQELPAGHRAIGLKWVFKLKRNEEGQVVKHKARLVAKGYVQKEGVDFSEVFAPVARLESVRLLLVIAGHHSWEVHHMDVKSAFLNGDLKEVVYVQQPPGFIDNTNPEKVLRLHKALYGLRQAPRAWNAKLDSTMLSLGFKQCASEHGMYTRGKAEQRLIVGVYVDDLIITGGDTQVLSSFKKEMCKTFKMSDLGSLSYYLGIEVQQSVDGITVCQGAYAKKIMYTIGLEEGNPSRTPMEPRLQLSKTGDTPAVDSTNYRSIVGSLRYLVNTRPDLAYSVGYVSRFMEAPREEHLAAVKRILRYVAGTIGWGVKYCAGRGGKLELIGYSDSDMAGDKVDRRSTSGMIYFLSNGPVCWLSAKQKVVALSSCEAEYIAASTTATHGVWLSRLMEELLGFESEAPLLFIDNKAAISLIKNPVLHDRSKHIEIRFHYIRECSEHGLIRIEFIRTEEQLGDIFTKSLARVKFEELRSKIGVQAIK